MKTITLENGVKIIVANDNIAHIFIKHFNQMPISVKISDTTASDIEKANHNNAPNLISDFNRSSY